MKYEKKRLVLNFEFSFSFILKEYFIEIYNRITNKTNLDSNTLWQQVVATLNEQSSVRDALPIGGGFISK
jgi:hypothetical protein